MFSSPFLRLHPDASCPVVQEWSQNRLAKIRERWLVIHAIAGLACVAAAWVLAVPVETVAKASKPNRLDQAVLWFQTAMATLGLLAVIGFLAARGEGAKLAYIVLAVLLFFFWALGLAALAVFVARTKARELAALRIAMIGLCGACLLVSVGFFLFGLSSRQNAASMVAR